MQPHESIPRKLATLYEPERKWTKSTTVYFLVSKTLFAAQYKIIFPFFPVLANSIGTTIQMFGWVVVAQQISALLSPYVVAQIEIRQLQIRHVQYACITVVIISNGFVPFTNTLTTFLITRFAAAMAYSVYAATVTAILALMVKAKNQGRLISLLEVSWAMSSFLALPMGFVMQLYGWWVPFVGLAVLCVPTMILTHLFVPLEHEEIDDDSNPNDDGTDLTFVSVSTGPKKRSPSRQRTVNESIREVIFDNTDFTLFWCFWGCTTVWLGFIFTIQGIWLSDAYSFEAEDIGFAAMITGGIELLAELSAVVFAVSYSKLSVALFSTGALLVSGCLIFQNEVAAQTLTFPFAIAYINLFLLSGQFCLVESMTIVVAFANEETRKTAVSMQYAILGLGIGIAGYAGPVLYEVQGIRGFAVVLVLACFVGTLFMRTVFVRSCR